MRTSILRVVEKQGAAMSRFEAADAQLGGAGERAGFGTEELRLQELIGERPGVDLHEGLVLPSGVGLDDLGQFFFAGAIGSRDEHGYVSRSDVHGERAELVHCTALVDQASQVEPLGELLPSARFSRAVGIVFALCCAPGQQVAHVQYQLGVVPRLADVVGGAFFDQFDRALQRGPSRDQDHRQVRIELVKRTKQLLAFFTGGGVTAEVHVLDHDPHFFVTHQLERFCRVSRRQAGETVHLEHDLKRGPDRVLIIHDQHLHTRLWVQGARGLGRGQVSLDESGDFLSTRVALPSGPR